MSDRWLSLALALVFAGCISSASTPCGDGIVCAPDLVCFHVTSPDEDRCVDRDQIRACDGVPAGMACTLDGVADAGRCYDGVCLLGGCGNGRVDVIDGEVCDDANAITGDRCSASCKSNETCGNGVVDPLVAMGGGEQCDDGATFAFDGCGATCRPETPQWAKVVTTKVPDPREHAAMAYDTARELFVLFGGTKGPAGPLAQLDDTWIYDGHAWQELTPSFSPAPRNGHALAYDAKRDRTVLFGGVGGNPQASSFDDMWQWNGTTWVETPHSATWPSSRVFATMAYDSARDVVVMFGGTHLTTLINLDLDDTWEWDGATWTERTPTNRPPTQTGHAMAYDPSRGVIVMVGQEPANPRAVVWEFDGTTWQRKARAVAPPARDFATVGYDSAQRAIVYAFGQATTVLGDAWSWDGQTWTSVASHDARVNATSASDPIHGQIVVQGGSPDLPTTTWAGSKWTKAALPTVRKRINASMAYDSVRGQLVLFGGAEGPTTLADTLVLGPTLSWSSGPTKEPGARVGAAMTFDPVRREVLLFGGSDAMGPLGDTWSWDGDPTHDWITRPGGPPARTGARMAYDQARDRVVLFGGSTGPIELDDTWEWNGAGWSLLTPPTSPRGRSEHVLAYDPIRKTTVLFGGHDHSTIYDDLWIWDGTTWATPSTGTTRPSPRWAAYLGWNPARGRITLFGGVNAAAFNDTWEWDGTSWSEVLGFNTPPRRAGGVMASAPDGSGVVLFGGLDPGGSLDQLWQLRWDATGPYEVCTGYSDLDGDGLRGCADPDCWSECSPECSPGVSCAASASRCGDGTCDPRETCRTCAADCGACVPICGDLVLDPGEACPGDVP